MADTRNKNETDEQARPAAQQAQPAAQQGDAGEAEVQRTVDQENEQGFRGVEVDPTPNENYTLQGVVAGKPTPETDPAQAAKVGSTRFRGSSAEQEQAK